MSEQEVAQESPKGQEGSDQQENSYDANELLKRVEQLEASKDRVLQESKEWKQKYWDLKNQSEKQQEEKLAKSENWKELLERERQKREQYEGQYQGLKKAVLQKDLHYQVAKLCPDAYDIEDVINSLPRDVIQINEQELSISNIDEAISLVKERKAHLFKKDKSLGQPNSRPSSDNGQKNEEQKKQAQMEAFKKFVL